MENAWRGKIITNSISLRFARWKMLGVVSSLAGLIKIRSSSTKVDDSTFRLHYRWTTSLFFLACALVAASDLIGGTIHCMNGNQAAEPPVVTYCWVMSTFTINTTHSKFLDLKILQFTSRTSEVYSEDFMSSNDTLFGLQFHQEFTKDHITARVVISAV